MTLECKEQKSSITKRFWDPSVLIMQIWFQMRKRSGNC